jgi:uncharacterized damage-inducible protein DinB
MNDQVLDTWNRHHRITLYLLEAVTPEGLAALPSGGKGRSPAQILAHLHNVRLMWLKTSAPDLLDGVDKIATQSKADKAAITKEVLRTALEQSSRAMEALLRRGLESGKVKNAPPHVMSFFGYLLAHEWYHLGELCMTLGQAGYPLPDQTLFGLWEWNQR